MHLPILIQPKTLRWRTSLQSKAYRHICLQFPQMWNNLDAKYRVAHYPWWWKYTRQNEAVDTDAGIRWIRFRQQHWRLRPSQNHQNSFTTQICSSASWGKIHLCNSQPEGCNGFILLPHAGFSGHLRPLWCEFRRSFRPLHSRRGLLGRSF